VSPVPRDATIQFRGRPVSRLGVIATVAVAAVILIAAVLVGIRQHKTPTAAEALKVALSQVGTTEDDAGGSKFNQWYMTTPFAKAGVVRDGGSISDYANASWCDMFVTWVGAQAGIKGIGGDAFTPAHARWFQQQGRWGSVPKPGAVVFFSWSGGGIAGIDHVGMVIKDNHDGTIQTVEGNTDNAVKIRTRSTDSVVGYGYPEYGE
jgi:cell wall-associated NlpC family hydrolase